MFFCVPLDIYLALPSIAFHVDFRLNSWSLVHAISTAVSGVLENIKAIFILVIFWCFSNADSEKSNHTRFQTKIHLPRLRFRWRHVVSGWTLLIPLQPSDAELYSLGMDPNRIKKFPRVPEISAKNRGTALRGLRSLRVRSKQCSR